MLGEAAGGRVLFDSSLKINENASDPPGRLSVPELRPCSPNMTGGGKYCRRLKRKGRKGCSGGRKSQACSPQAIKQKVQEMTERFRLIGLEKHYPAQLSGGQQQRTALARILAYEPEIPLLDEPFSAMDTYLREKLRLELAEALKDYDGVSILVTHDRDEAYQLCPEILLMDQGKGSGQGKDERYFAWPPNLQGCKTYGLQKYFQDQADG